jgi:hypothetical protein
MDTVRTQKELTVLHKAKVETLIILGHHLHKLVRDGAITDPGLVQLSGKVSKLDAEIYVGSGSHVPAQGAGICPGCGEQLSSAVTAFCGKCGTNVKEFYSRDMAPCASCRQLVQSTAQYCVVCGVNRGQQQ